MEFRQANILVALFVFPTVEPETYEAVWKLHEYSKYGNDGIKRNNIEIIFPDSAGVALARNEAVEVFLNHKQFDSLLIIDRDHIMNKHSLQWMYEADKDVIAGVACKKLTEYSQLIHLKSPFVPTETAVHGLFFDQAHPEGVAHSYSVEELMQKIEKEGYNPFQVPQTGTGMMLIKRKVFEGIPKPYFAEPPDPFLEGETTGVDIYFCRKACKYGFEIWVHPDVSLIHIGRGYTGADLP